MSKYRRRERGNGWVCAISVQSQVLNNEVFMIKIKKMGIFIGFLLENNYFYIKNEIENEIRGYFWVIIKVNLNRF